MKKLKPFDLKAALNGEPVMLRNGAKAYVRHHETELDVSDYNKLLGHCDGNCLTWREDGYYFVEGAQTKYNIIGMYPKTRTVNGFEVPAPETEIPTIGSTYFVANGVLGKFFDVSAWRNDKFDNLWLERGLVFLNKEDAIANAKAMLGIDPESPGMD